MTSFIPLNVEIEEDSEDEIDDSKEIQIEEALKLYQNALKLHSQGPKFYDAAEQAYRELFQSEIFTWEESLSEAQAIERFTALEDSDDDSENLLIPVPTAPATAVDGTPNSLPQILYLAYKNHGQFQLDRLRHRLSSIEGELMYDTMEASSGVLPNVASSSLKLFVEALDKDDTDLELWRLVSRIGGFLGSHRIARFSLEAVLDNDEGDFIEPFGLDVGFAREQLRPLLQTLDDQLSKSQVSSAFGKYRSIIPSFKKRVDPCPYLHVPSQAPNKDSTKVGAKRQVIKVPLRSYASCGKAIQLRLDQETQGTDEPDPGASYTLELPSHKPLAIPMPSSKHIDQGRIATSQGQQPLADGHVQTNIPSRLQIEAIETARQWESDATLDPSPTNLNPNASAIGNVSESPTKVDGPGIAETEVLELDSAAKQTENPEMNAGPIILASLPTRKRSSETAEIPDSTDVGRSRSKRIKTRGSWDPAVFKDSTTEDWAKWYQQQLQIYHQADDLAFCTIATTLSKLSSEVSTSVRSLREIISDQRLDSGPGRADIPSSPLDLVAQDLKFTLNAWDLERSKAFLNGHDSKNAPGSIDSNHYPGFGAFLESSNQNNRRLSDIATLYGDRDPYDIEELVSEIGKQEWISLSQLAYRWLDKLLLFPTSNDVSYESTSWYENYLWPDILKESVVQMLVYQDQAIYSELTRLIDETEQQGAKTNQPTHTLFLLDNSSVAMTEADEAKRKYTNLTQTIYELHLDVYSLITNPSSIVDEATRLLQRDRLGRWAALASKLVNQWSWPGNEAGHWSQASDNLHVRFLWASVVCNSLLEPTSRENTILCYQELTCILQSFRKKPDHAPFIILLPNNAIMPEISIEAAQKEISRLKTMDFFMGILNPEHTDPLTTIESLEPLLDLSAKYRNVSADQNGSRVTREPTVTGTNLEASMGCQALDVSDETTPDSQLLEALSFLKQGSLPLRLFLWQKLRDAYRAIAYPPQVVSCDLRMVALIIEHLTSSSYGGSSLENRYDSLLRWLHRLDDHVTRVLSIVLSKDDAFDCLDSDHLRTSLEALTSLQKLLHVFALWEDTIRVGKTPPPVQVNQNATRGLARSTDKFRDMIVKTWTLQYLLLKETMSQNTDFFESSPRELIKHLEHVHQALGLRCYCSLANKVFLKLMKTELEKFKTVEGWEIDMSQLMYDLYAVKVSPIAIEMQDHGCLSESLDRNTALEIMDLVMTQVNRINTKDLLKSDLKFTIDKMQQVIMIPKITNSTARTFNFRLTNNYLKSPLNPYDLYRSLRGIGGLCGMLSHDEGSDIAIKGWYFLLGHIALAKFRSLKRSSAGSTDDLSISKAFLRHDLEFDTDRWETWYRLGQVYDAMIEEDTTWTADKLDNHMDELVDLQRKAIHCYSMAIAVATRLAEGSFEDTSKIADLCADFGTRVYASTREPFSMKAFSLDDYKRHYNSRAMGMYQDLPFRSMQLYSAWKFASILLRRASAQKPHNWSTSYVYGKVLWKMHNCSDEVRGSAKRIGFQPAIDAFIRAIEACPEKRDNRHPDKDPILEPHYKLLSVVHKLVRSKRILPEEGRHILQATPYARKAPDLVGDEGWNGYVWQILKALRAADKANWHHRMVARAAHIMYDDEPNDPRSAVGARNELSQQIFTKTMAIQVWKPDNERAGRHFVYTGKYVRFFTRLLYQLNDKMSLEALARRIRKRSGEFVNHGSVWEEVCRAYLKLLHHQPYCTITDGFSELIFQGIDPDSFQSHAARLEAYVHAQQASPPLLDILREAIELKKLNNNLFRPVNPFEDLIRDIYAHLYDSIIPSLIKNDAAEENRVRMRVDNILSNPMPSMVETPPPEGSSAQGGEPPKKSGARYVTAREIVRKAEAIAAKPAPTVPAKVLKPLAPAPALEMGAKPPSDAPRLAVVINNDGAGDAGSSVPGSVHDSADDESELSEMDDGAAAEAEPEAEVGDEAALARSPLFPNLTTQGQEDVQGDPEDERPEGEDIDVMMEAEDADDPEADPEPEPEPMEGDGPNVANEQEVDVKAPEVTARESGVHEGNW